MTGGTRALVTCDGASVPRNLAAQTWTDRRALVPHGKSGLVCAPEPEAIAKAIVQFYEMGEAHFLPGLKTEREKYSWENLVAAIRTIAEAATGT